MAYSELIKDFSRIREYMRQFYIYGFKTRDEYDGKSARSYDNERRRVESWLGEYMAFRQDPSGKAVFISVDSREILRNPLYNAFKAKSFTSNDIALHFYILDVLENHEECTVSEIADIISREYSCEFCDAKTFDESTIRNKLKEYEKLGILHSKKTGRRLYYMKSRDEIDLERWKEAVTFFSELDPLGVTGSYILDKTGRAAEYFSHKHHYILHALESEIMCRLLDSMSRDETVHITVFSRKRGSKKEAEIVPVKILIGTQTGRSYVCGLSMEDGVCNMYRLDNIEKVRRGEVFADKKTAVEAGEEFMKHIWYTSFNNDRQIYHLEMVLRIEEQEMYILRRLEREGKQGRIEELGDNEYRYSIDVYDPGEMIPWLRTFTGRVVSLKCNDKETEELFYRDMESMYEMYGIYGGDSDAVQ